MAHPAVAATIYAAALATLGAVGYAVSVTPPSTFDAPPPVTASPSSPLDTTEPRIVYRDRVVTEQVEVEKRVEVPVEVTVPDPAAYDQGYADARAEFEVTEDYLADWWEDGRDAGESAVYRDAPLPGGLIDPASVAAAVDTPCASEDSVNCYWRADVFGNGEGTSFLNVEGHIFPIDAVLAAGSAE